MNVAAWFFLLLTVLGMALSFYLVPKDEELGLMFLKDKKFTEAKQIFTQKYNEGNRSKAVTIPLARLHLQYGNVTSAVTLMEEVVEENPELLDGLKILARYYQYAQRPDDHRLILERISKLEPTKKNLLDLSSIYNNLASYKEQINILRRLTKLYPDMPQNFIDLANLEAATGDLKGGAKTMTHFARLFPDQMNNSKRELLLNLLLSSKQFEEGFIKAQQWLVDSPAGRREAALFASLFHSHEKIVLALELLDKFQDNSWRYTPLLSELVELEMAAGFANRAFIRLNKLHKDGRLDESLYPTLLILAMERGWGGYSQSLAQTMELDTIPQWIREGLIIKAINSNHNSIVDRLMGKDNNEFQKSNPVLVARVALYKRQNKKLAHWINYSIKQQGLGIDKQLDLALLCIQSGYKSYAQQLLEGVLSRNKLPDTVLADLGNIYLETGQFTHGSKQFKHLLKKQPSKTVAAYWVRLAVGAGQYKAAEAWLVKQPVGSVDQQVLLDIYYGTFAAKKYALAEIVSKRLFHEHGGVKNRKRVVQVLLASNKTWEALQHLRVLVEGGDVQMLASYGNALRTAMGEGKLDIAEWVAFLDKKLNNQDLSAEERRGVAYQYLDVGLKEPSENIFKQLAEISGPDGTDIKQLLYLWGPRPKKRDMDWLANRSQQKQTAEYRSKWLGHILSRGGSQRVVALVEEGGVVDMEFVVAKIYLQALIRIGDNNKFSQTVNKLLTKTRTKEELQEILTLVDGQNLDNLAKQVYMAVLEQNPNDSSSLKRLGFISFRGRFWQDAKHYLGRYLAIKNGSWRENYYLGETLSSLKEPEQARGYYKKAMVRLEKIEQKNYEMNVALGQIYYRLKRFAAALEIYSSLIRKYPDNDDIRADYSLLLLGQGELKQAGSVLGYGN
ncbi:MAG: tetratricopeptide repeat protein [Magnetococcales bacterium]|nr:tetratricopeptide repeat protein [Magnetococcales bacterium]